MGVLKIFLFICTVIPFVTQTFGQTGTVTKSDTSGVYRLSDVVVTATKSNTNLLELANSITIIDSADISNRNKINVFELLKSEYGVSYTTQGPQGTLANISIRGGDVGNTVVMIDGIKMNLTSDPANVYDFASLTVESIDRIEILRGPQSMLYGSDALSGVVNIISKKGNGKPLFSLVAEGGSYNTFKGALGLSGSEKAFNYNLSFGRTQSEGFSAASEKYGNTEKDGYEGNNFVSRFGFDFSDDTFLDLFVRFTKSDADYDQIGGESGDDPTYKYNQEEFVTRAETGFKTIKGLWDQRVGLSFYRNMRKYKYDSTLYNPASSRSLYDGKRFKLDWLNTFNLPWNNFVTFGLDAELDQSTSQFYLLSSFGPFESVIPKSNVSIVGVYLQDQIKFDNRIFATGGIRYDNHEKFGSAFTYRFAPAYIIWETGTKLKATVGTGFKAPSIFYLYDPFFGNDSLKPERSFGWDIGIEQYLWSERVTIGATYFNNKFTDLLGSDENFKTININEAESNGIEAFINTIITDELFIKINYTYLQTEDEGEDSVDKGMPLLRRPRNKVALITSYNFLERANVTFEIIYNDIREDKNFSTFPATRVTLPSYTLLNIAAQFEVLNWLKVTGRVDNLLNVDYEDIFGYATPGLSGYAGVKINF
ncbi:MAG: TonB-dependent receptor [Ignavibacteriaceae bacterium]